jgi:hypothetical protein
MAWKGQLGWMLRPMLSPGKNMAVFGRLDSVERHLDWYVKPLPRLLENLARGRVDRSSRMTVIGTNV